MRKQAENRASPSDFNSIESKLEAIDLPTLLTICVDVLAVCAKRATKIDPAVGAMIAYARDEIIECAGNEFG